MEKEPTISDALKINSDWVTLNERKIEDELSNCDTVSECIESIIKRVKTEEFGEGDYENISDYEKKILFAGFLLGQLIVQRQEAAKIGEVIGHILQSRRPK